MAEWRLGRGWTEEELRERLIRLRDLDLNFRAAQEEMSLARGWNHYYSEAVIAYEPPGEPVPDGPFQEGCVAVANYQLSDPAIVIGHFDPDVPLLGREMLLELIALRVLRYLAGVRVGAVREEQTDGRTVFGFRYDTLEGHIEMGSEWFLLTKDHASGEISFRIDAHWLPGEFPNWWSRLGFMWVGPSHQKDWHHRAHGRLSRLLHEVHPETLLPAHGRLAHQGPEVEFKYFRGREAQPEPEQWREEEDIVQSR